MASSSIANYIKATYPKMNEVIAGGYSTHQLKKVVSHMDRIIRSAAVGFPKQVVYKGITLLTPEQEYAEIVRKGNDGCRYDIAHSDVFMVGIDFECFGTPVRKCQFLPYSITANEIIINGSKHNIAAVVADRIISVLLGSIFVKLLKAKIMFERTSYHCVENGNRINSQVIHSEMYHKKTTDKTQRPTIKAKHTLGHYLFSKYGVMHTFEKYGKCAPVILSLEDDLTPYLNDQWSIYQSAEIKPAGLGKLDKEKTNIIIAVKNCEVNKMSTYLIVNFFYIADHFPLKIIKENIFDNRIWMTTLGELIWNSFGHVGRLYTDVLKHLQSLDEYVDNIYMTKEFENIGIYIENIYDLFSYLIYNFNEMLLDADDRVCTLWNKELSVLYYVLYDLIENVHCLYFDLRSIRPEDLSQRKVLNVINRNIKPRTIFKINTHQEVSATGDPTVCMAFKTTIVMVPQSNTTGGRRRRAGIKDPALRVHASSAEVGGYCNLVKALPDGRTRVNPYVNVTEEGTIVRNPEFETLLNQAQEKLKR